ncbi:MAG: bifunctional phosphoribosylaminoimidazolecarboxamide formyltransferase/IMP cyclohydrolase, partial [Pseudomonadota bacterium]
MARIHRAILSVSDKRGLLPLAKQLASSGIEILSTGGTARALQEGGVATTSIAHYTGAPEILGGRVKTLHPKIHGGILARPDPEHQSELQQHGIGQIDLVVVNLYPFRETVAKPNVSFAEAIEQIDIGGPTMVRAAAKNYERVAIVVDPDDYQEVCRLLDENDGEIPRSARFRLAKKAFAHTASYDGAVAAYLSSFPEEGGEREPFPLYLAGQWHRQRLLRYGENPHQSAAQYVEDKPTGPSLGCAEVLQGKELSYNNLVDLDAALECVLDFSGPAAVVVKHTNPCGVAIDSTGIAAAYRKAREADPVSAYGGIVALNEPVDEETAAELSETFLECVIAPGFGDGAR